MFHKQVSVLMNWLDQVGLFAFTGERQGLEMTVQSLDRSLRKNITLICIDKRNLLGLLNQKGG